MDIDDAGHRWGTCRIARSTRFNLAPLSRPSDPDVPVTSGGQGFGRKAKGGAGVRFPSAVIAIVAVVCGVTEARSQTIKSAVYINLESYVSAPTPIYSGLACGGNCNTIALKLCTGIGYKYGTPVRMINTQMGGAVCFDTIGSSFSIEDGNLVVRDRRKK